MDNWFCKIVPAFLTIKFKLCRGMASYISCTEYNEYSQRNEICSHEDHPRREQQHDIDSLLWPIQRHSERLKFFFHGFDVSTICICPMQPCSAGWENNLYMYLLAHMSICSRFNYFYYLCGRLARVHKDRQLQASRRILASNDPDNDKKTDGGMLS